MGNSYWLLLLTFITTLTNAQIAVSSNHKFLVSKDGRPFFWLGDTDWELFHRLTREEIKEFIDTRSEQGYNVLQCVALADLEGIRKPNRYGDYPLNNEDPTQLLVTPGNNPDNEYEYDYWDHVDYAVQLAAAKGMYIGLLPTWGDKVTHNWGFGPTIFNVSNAEAYGKLLAERYKDQWNIIWILGGDRPAVYTRDQKNWDDRPIWSAMAKGIQRAEGDDVFLTYHPAGGDHSTSTDLQDQPWMHMNAFQSSHGSRDIKSWDLVERDLALKPLKPTMDMEPCYEDHPVNPWDGKWTKKERGYFNAYDVRARSYRSVFAGGCGITYGHQQIWQFVNEKLYKPLSIGDTLIGWQKAMKAEAAGEMQHLKNLMLSRPYLSRIADQSLIKSENGKTYIDHIRATRDENGSYAMIYLPRNKPLKIDLKKLSGSKLKAYWYDVRTGKSTTITGNLKGVYTFQPPKQEKDWVLVIDDASKNYPTPGENLN